MSILIKDYLSAFFSTLFLTKADQTISTRIFCFRNSALRANRMNFTRKPAAAMKFLGALCIHIGENDVLYYKKTEGRKFGLVSSAFYICIIES